MPHLSPLTHAARPSFNSAYHAPNITWNPSQTQPAPLVIPPRPVAAPPPAELTNTDPNRGGDPGWGGSGGSGPGGAGDGGGDGGGGGGDDKRGGTVRRHAPGGIIGYDDGGDVDETQMSILSRVSDPSLYANDPQFSSKLVNDEIMRRAAAASPQPSAPQPNGARYTGRRPRPGPASLPQDPNDPTADTSPFLGYRHPVRAGAVPQRRDPTASPVGAPEPDPLAPYSPGGEPPFMEMEPSEDYDWPPPDLPARSAPAGGGIVADSDGNLPMPPTANPGPRPQDGGIAPPSGYTHDYQPRQPSGRSKEARELAPWMALINGGAGMLSSRSPNFGVALGEGLKAGTGSYSKDRTEADRMAEREDEQRDTGSFHKANLDMQAKRFSDAAEHAKATLQAQTKHYADQAEHQAAQTAETGRHNRVQEGKGYAEPVRNLTNPDGSPMVDKDGVPQALWMDRTNNRTYQGPAPDPAVMGAGRARQGGGTSDLVQHLLNEGTVKTWQEGMAMVRDPSGKNASVLRTATERLALQAAKADPEYQSDSKATTDRWRAYYGAGIGPAGNAGGGIASPKTQAEFDALPSGALYVNPADGAQYKKK